MEKATAVAASILSKCLARIPLREFEYQYFYDGCNFKSRRVYLGRLVSLPLKMFSLFIVTVIVGLMLGVMVGVLVVNMTGDRDLAGLVGTAVWLFSWIVMHTYGFAWVFDPAVDRLNARGEGKLQTAEIRIGFVWAMIGGGLAAAAKASCAIIGGLLGYDVKRRVRRKREQWASQQVKY
jgi:hypothetical protein